ncbi:MAG: FAD-dependent oxidoreductase, partial [Gammaproteobacteria bacterium]|nr:FAD-dependent oxidoreductase [Gammaproteobacteria bacterium]
MATETSATTSGNSLHAEVVVLGAGPGGYTAAFRAADLGQRVVLIERYAALGGVCLNVGCIPSKALLHVAHVIHDAEESAPFGIRFATPEIDLDKLRDWKGRIVKTLNTGLSGLAKQRQVTVVHGLGSFVSDREIRVESPDGATTVTFDNAI